MKHISAAICLVVLVVFKASAHTIPEEGSSVDATFDSAASRAAQDAVHVADILREVAQTLAEDEEIYYEGDEYFFRDLWEKTKGALKNATKNVKESVKKAYKEAKGHIKKATQDAQKKLKDKAAEIMSELLTKMMSGYALEDSESRGNFVKMFLNAIMQAAQRLMKMGKALGSIQD